MNNMPMTGTYSESGLMQNAPAPSLQVRPVTNEDRDWLFSLHEQAHRELVERAYGPWEVEQQRGFFDPVVNDHDVFILSDGHQNVGAVYIGERDGDVWLELVEVLPDFQRRGYGTIALRWVVSHASEQGMGTLLQVHRVNEDARRLYLSEGFSAAGETDTHHLLRKSAQN